MKWLRSHSQSGFTLTEILVVSAILIFLAAIVYPIIAKAIGASKKSVTVSNLRQLAQATAMYRTSYSESDSGTWQQMGLPSDLFALDLDPKLIATLGPNRRGLIMMYTNQGSTLTWEQYTQKRGGSSILFGDLSWTDLKNDISEDGDIKTGFGAYLDTHVRRRVSKGDWVDFEWWHEEAELMD